MSGLSRFAAACAVRFVLCHIRRGSRLPVLLRGVAELRDLRQTVQALHKETAAHLDGALLTLQPVVKHRRKRAGGQFKRRGRKRAGGDG